MSNGGGGGKFCICEAFSRLSEVKDEAGLVSLGSAVVTGVSGGFTPLMPPPFAVKDLPLPDLPVLPGVPPLDVGVLLLLVFPLFVSLLCAWFCRALARLFLNQTYE